MSTDSALSQYQYWQQFTIQQSDLDHLANFLVERERPHTVDELAYELVRYRQEQLTELAKRSLSQGRVYHPAETYHVGEQLIFPHFGNALGEVIAVRPGRNQEYEPFSVIKVRLNDGEREFVADLQHPHKLNEVTLLPADEASPEEIYNNYGDHIRSILLEALEQSPQFVNVAHKWFLRALLVEISPGLLNIAEAMLDMAGGGPMRTEELMKEIDLPAEVPEELRQFSLEYALLRDARFDEVGPAGYALWYLRSLEPKEVLETPPLLQYVPIPYNRQVLDETMLSLEQRASDEWSELPVAGPSSGPATIVLNYPHWRSGTLPLAPHVAHLFPTARLANRIRFTFVDDVTGETYPGWVVRSGRYVYGLKNWFAAKQVLVGTLIDLKPSDDPGFIRIAVRPFRTQRGEWLRTVTVEGDNLLFEVTRVPVACEFDELAAVAVMNPDALDALRPQFSRASLETLLERAFSGLAGLSLQRAVHAMTLYSVLNLMRRVPPAPMLATLAVSPRYVSLGDDYWAYRGEE